MLTPWAMAAAFCRSRRFVPAVLVGETHWEGVDGNLDSANPRCLNHCSTPRAIAHRRTSAIVMAQPASSLERDALYIKLNHRRLSCQAAGGRLANEPGKQAYRRSPHGRDARHDGAAVSRCKRPDVTRRRRSNRLEQRVLEPARERQSPAAE